jgi:hypothetical protein
MVLTFGKAVPAGPGKRVSHPFAEGETTVTLRANDLADAEIPHTPATVTFRTAPDAMAGPPRGPLAFRVSMIRHAGTRKNDAAAAGGAATETVAVLLFADPQEFVTRTQ